MTSEEDGYSFYISFFPLFFLLCHFVFMSVMPKCSFSSDGVEGLARGLRDRSLLAELARKLCVRVCMLARVRVCIHARKGKAESERKD